MADEGTPEEVLIDVDGGVAVITLNRPHRLNAVTPIMSKAYVEALWAMDNSPDVRVIVVTGAGRAFCAGADLAELSKGAAHLEQHFTSADIAPHAAMHLRKPVIAAVNGPVAGMGLAYVLAADIRFADPTGTMQTTFAKLGLVAEYGIAWLLPRLIGQSRATELLMSARPFTADEALRIGLVHEVSAPGEVLAHAVAYAHGLVATCSPHSLAAVKHQLLADGAGSFADSVTKSYALMEESFHGPDLAEALVARSEKRAPQFTALPARPPLRT